MKKVEPLTKPGHEKSGLLKKAVTKFRQMPTGPRMAIDVLIIVSIFGLLLAITPGLRFKLLNAFSRSMIELTIVDSTDSFPVYEAKVSINDQEYESDKEGKIYIDEAYYGDYEATIEKSGYETTEFEFTSDQATVSEEVKLQSNGRRVKVQAKEFLSNNPIQTFVVRTSGDNPTSAIGVYGSATLSLPADVTLEFGGSIQADHFADKPITIDASESRNNEYSLIPSGNHFFLDSRGGATTIYTSDLDGGNEQRFIEPTGFEDTNSKLYTDPNGNFAIYEASRRQEIVDGVQLRQLYAVNLKTGDVIEVDSGKPTWQIVDVNENRAIYMATKGDSSLNDNESVVMYDFKSNQTTVLFSSKDLHFPAAINGNVLVAEMIERSSYPGGYLLRQLVAINEKTGDYEVLSEDATITDIFVSTPIKIQYSLINPQNKQEITFVYDTNLDEAFQASEVRSAKKVAKADFADNAYAWTSNEKNGGRLSFGDSEGDVSIYYELGVKGFVISQWLDSKYLILHSPGSQVGTNGMVFRIDNGKASNLP